jgi:hypothetical protein
LTTAAAAGHLRPSLPACSREKAAAPNIKPPNEHPSHWLAHADIQLFLSPCLVPSKTPNIAPIGPLHSDDDDDNGGDRDGDDEDQLHANAKCTVTENHHRVVS